MKDRLDNGDGTFLLSWAELNQMAVIEEADGARYWQSIHNNCTIWEQLGWRIRWPELFYAREHELGMQEFNKYFEIVDGYVMPKET